MLETTLTVLWCGSVVQCYSKKSELVQLKYRVPAIEVVKQDI